MKLLVTLYRPLDNHLEDHPGYRDASLFELQLRFTHVKSIRKIRMTDAFFIPPEAMIHNLSSPRCKSELSSGYDSKDVNRETAVS